MIIFLQLKSIKCVIKIALSLKAIKKLKIESIKSNKANADPLWGNHVLGCKNILLANISILMSALTKQEEYKIIEYFNIRYESQKNNKKENAYELLDVNILNKFFYSNSIQNKAKNIFDNLKSFKLPVNSTHGDFHLTNIVSSGESFKLIDWDCYEEKSSFIYDVAHYYLDEICKNMNLSWTKIILERKMVLNSINKYLDVYSISYEQFVVFYSMKRIALEINQELGLKNLSKQKEKKYLDLIDEINKTIICYT